MLVFVYGDDSSLTNRPIGYMGKACIGAVTWNTIFGFFQKGKVDTFALSLIYSNPCS